MKHRFTLPLLAGLLGVSVSVHAVVPSTPSISTPSKVIVKQGFNISFGAVSGATSYKIYENGSLLTNRTASPVYRKIYSTGTHTHQVQACNASGCSPLSGSVSISVNDPIPSTPSGASVPSSAIPAANFVINFGTSTYADYYKVFENGSLLTTRTAPPVVRKLYTAGAYTYNVQACNESGCSGTSSSDTVNIQHPVPSTPSGLSLPSSITRGQNFNLSYNSVANAISYKIYRNGSHFTTSNTTSKTINAYYAGTESYQVSACNSTGCSSLSSPRSITIVNPVPATPSGVSVPSSVTTGTNFNLTYNSVAYATSYNIYRNGSLFTTSTTTSKTINAYSEGSEYYQVSACNSSGCSSLSSSDTITIKDPVPAVPTGFTVPSSAITGDNFFVSYGAVPYAKIYKINRNGAPFTTSTTTSKEINAYQAGSEYYQVSACNNTGCSGFTSAQTITIKDPVPAVPSGLTVPTQVVTKSKFNIEFEQSENAKYYQIYEARGTGTSSLLAERNAADFSSGENIRLERQVLVEGDFTYSVRACNSSGVCSNKSAGKTVKVKDAELTIPTLTMPNSVVVGDVFEVTINQTANATYYNVLQDGGVLTAPQADINSSTVSFDRKILEVGSYIYQVQACAASGCTASSVAYEISVVDQAPESSRIEMSRKIIVDGSFELQFAQVPGAQYYKVFKNGIEMNLNSIISSPVIIDVGSELNVDSYSNFDFMIQACNAGGCADSQTRKFALKAKKTDEAILQDLVSRINSIYDLSYQSSVDESSGDTVASGSWLTFANRNIIDYMYQRYPLMQALVDVDKVTREHNFSADSRRDYISASLSIAEKYFDEAIDGVYTVRGRTEKTFKRWATGTECPDSKSECAVEEKVDSYIVTGHDEWRAAAGIATVLSYIKSNEQYFAPDSNIRIRANHLADLLKVHVWDKWHEIAALSNGTESYLYDEFHHPLSNQVTHMMGRFGTIAIALDLYFSEPESASVYKDFIYDRGSKVLSDDLLSHNNNGSLSYNILTYLDGRLSSLPSHQGAVEVSTVDLSHARDTVNFVLGSIEYNYFNRSDGSTLFNLNAKQYLTNTIVDSLWDQDLGYPCFNEWVDGEGASVVNVAEFGDDEYSPEQWFHNKNCSRIGTELGAWAQLSDENAEFRLSLVNWLEHTGGIQCYDGTGDAPNINKNHYYAIAGAQKAESAIGCNAAGSDTSNQDFGQLQSLSSLATAFSEAIKTQAN